MIFEIEQMEYGEISWIVKPAALLVLDELKFHCFHDLITRYAVSRGKAIDGRPQNGFLRNFANRQAWPLDLYVTINKND